MKTILAVFLAVIIGSTSAYAQDKLTRKLTFERDNAVWIANIDGNGQKKLAIGQSPDLSPDGTKLAYSAASGEGKDMQHHIAVIDLATNQTTVLKDIPNDDCIEPSWSHDGKQLLYGFYVTDAWHIGVINADGTGFRDVQRSEPKHHDYWSKAWAADGKSFYTQDMVNLYQLDLNAKVIKQWVIEKLIPHGVMSGGIRLDASPDGKSLLMDVEMDEKERKDWDGPPPAISLLDLATEKVTRLTPPSLYAWDSHWLQAPESILFVSANPGEDTEWIYRMSTTGQGKDKQLLVKNGVNPGSSR